MFRSICIAVLMSLLSAHAYADEWRESDTHRESVFQVVNVIDWGQTRYIAKHPDTFHESDSAWLISKHPSTTDVDRLMFASAILHPIISYYLPHGWREAFQYVTIGGKLNATIANASIGIKFEF